MDKDIILVKLDIGYNNSGDTFHFQTRKGVKISSLKDCEGHDTIHFTNNTNPDWAERACFGEKYIPILIGKDAKFDRLHVKGYMHGKKYETILDSMKSVQQVTSDHDEKYYIYILKHSDQLIFEIL